MKLNCSVLNFKNNFNDIKTIFNKILHSFFIIIFILNLIRFQIINQRIKMFVSFYFLFMFWFQFYSCLFVEFDYLYFLQFFFFSLTRKFIIKLNETWSFRRIKWATSIQNFGNLISNWICIEFFWELRSNLFLR